MKELISRSCFVLVVCLLVTLTGCSEDEDEVVGKKVAKAEVRVDVTLSEDALDLLSLHVQGKVTESGHLQQNEVVVASTSKRCFFTATKFPATIEAPVSVSLKKLPTTLKDKYDLQYKVEYMVIVTYDDDSNEAFDGGPMGFGVSAGYTGAVADEEDLTYFLNLIKEEIEEKCNFAKTLEVKNGKISL